MTDDSRDAGARLRPMAWLVFACVVIAAGFAPGAGSWFAWLPISPLILHAPGCPADEHSQTTHVHTIVLHGTQNLWSVCVWLLLVASAVVVIWWPPAAKRLAQVGLVIGSVSLASSTASWLEPSLLSGRVPVDLPCAYSPEQFSDAVALADYERAVIPVFLLTLLIAYLTVFDRDDLRTALRLPLSSYRWRWTTSIAIAVVAAAPYLLVVGILFYDQQDTGEAVWWLLLPVFLPLLAAPLSLVPQRSYRRVGTAAGLAALTVVFGHWSSVGLVRVSRQIPKLDGNDFRPESTLSETQEALLRAEAANLLALILSLSFLLGCSFLVSRLLLRTVAPPSPGVILLRVQRGSTASWVTTQQTLWRLGCSTVTREGHARHLVVQGARVFELDPKPEELRLLSLGRTAASDRVVTSIPQSTPIEEMLAEVRRHVVADVVDGR